MPRTTVRGPVAPGQRRPMARGGGGWRAPSPGEAVARPLPDHACSVGVRRAAPPPPPTSPAPPEEEA